ncbi:MAG: cellulose biosynthesis protein, partial [Planctomycetota bacterium]
MADVVEVNELQQLQQYRMVWNSLWPATPRKSFFHTIDWLERLWGHFGSERKFRILVVRAAG